MLGCAEKVNRILTVIDGITLTEVLHYQDQFRSADDFIIKD